MNIYETTAKTTLENLYQKKIWNKPRFWVIQTKETQTKRFYSSDGFSPDDPGFSVKIES
jgi:hypothetical protein